ncbi:MAG: hypothetical protein ABSE99_16385 [Terracidiphilus sp.]|jgi:hypothetical protein
MKTQRFAVGLLAGVFALGAGLAFAQQDEGPILRPKPQPKPAGATLLVMCDLACNWKLDGEAKGRIEAGGSAKARVELGQHVVAAATEDALDKIETEIEVKTAGQTVQRLALQPVRDARLKAEQQARENAEQEAKEKAAQQEAQEKAERDARDKAARERQEQEQQELRAAELNQQGMTLYSYPADGFSAYYPSRPEVTQKTVSTETGPVEMRSYLASASSTALFIAVSDYRAQIASKNPDTVLQTVKKGAMASSKARILSEKQILLGVYHGLEFEAESDQFHFSARVYMVGATLYQTLVVSPLADRYPDAARFLDSFHLIPRSAQ